MSGRNGRVLGAWIFALCVVLVLDGLYESRGEGIELFDIVTLFAVLFFGAHSFLWRVAEDDRKHNKNSPE